MSELDFLLNRKKSIEKKEEKSTVENVEKAEERRDNIPVEKTIEEEEKKNEKREKTIENTPESTKNIEEEEKKEDSREDSIESIMKKFLEKDPKIGIWSYPAYLVLQYLYNTKPGFKMSKVAREALEYGLKHMYPDLFSKAEKISQLKQR